MQQESDDALAERARNGDEAAFAALVERHWPTAYRVAYRWCGSRADAEDVAQEVCVKLARAIAGYRGEAAFATWITRLAINAVRDLMRMRRRHAGKVAALALVAPGDCDGGADDAVSSSELWRAVHDLPARQRDAILLVYGEGMSHAEAAAVLGCRETTLSWHVHEAKKRLRRRLGDDDEQEPRSAGGATGASQEARSAGGATGTSQEARSAGGATGTSEEARSAGGATGASQEARSAGGATGTSEEARSAGGATGTSEEARSAGGATGDEERRKRDREQSTGEERRKRKRGPEPRPGVGQ